MFTGKDTTLRMEFLILALLLGTPLVFHTQMSFGVLSFKYFWLYFCCLLASFRVVYSLAIGTFRFTALDVWVVLFIVYLVVLELLQNGSVENTSKKTNVFAGCGVAYLLTRQMVMRAVQTVRKFFTVCISIITFLVLLASAGQLLGILPSFNHSYRVTATFFHPAVLAGFLALVFPFLFFECIKSFSGRRKRKSLLLILAVTILILTIIALKSRSSFVGIIVASVYILLHLPAPDKRVSLFSGLSRSGIFMATILVLAGIMALYFIRPSSVNGRVLIWEISTRMISENLVTGVGADQFKSRIPLYQIEYFRNGRSSEKILLSDEVTSPFNELIHIASEFGLVGLLLFVAVIITTFIKPRKRLAECGDPSLQITSKAALLCFLTYGLFEYPFSLPEMTIYFFILLALSGDSGTEIVHPYTRVTKVFPILISLFLAIQVRTITLELKAYIQWYQGINTTDIGNSLNILSKQFPVLKKNEQFLSSYAIVLAKAGNIDGAISVMKAKKWLTYDDYLIMAELEQQKGNIDKVIWYTDQAHHLLPSRFVPLMNLLNIYYSARRDYGKAKSLANEIMSMPVKVQSAEAEKAKDFAKSVLEHLR